MAKTIILLNGPPKAGKDTIGSELQRLVPGMELLKFADPLRVFVKTTLGWSDEMLEAGKSLHVPLWGMTVREAMISYSEDFCKPKFGADYFGRLMAHRLNNKLFSDVICITDSGFAPEAQVLIDMFGAQSVFLVRLFRNGTSFDGDSRSYITLPDVRTLDVENNDSPLSAAMRILRQAKMTGYQLPL